MKSTKLLNSLHISGTFYWNYSHVVSRFTLEFLDIQIDPRSSTYVHIVSHVSILRLATKWGGTSFWCDSKNQGQNVTAGMHDMIKKNPSQFKDCIYRPITPSLISPSRVLSGKDNLSSLGYLRKKRDIITMVTIKGDNSINHQKTTPQKRISIIHQPK